ncbi:Na+/H+ antiporter subunit E [Coralloluteibacterium thermophilus]|uniref:Na+/H+ antiporter subunit E n=1 Tax=Coralloluteibacterium thermophilum TaxID=2707049 RepID=A0ABV9NEL9_9GAMM
MSRLFPAPLLSVAVFLTWLLLANSIAPGQLLLGAVFGIALPWLVRDLRDDRPRMRRPGVALRLALRVGWDILVGSVDVARRILGRESAIRPEFVWVPLDIRDVHGISALAGIITLTPGTLSAELSEDRRHLLVHCFHTDDAQSIVRTIKTRYEAPLMEIFP